MSGRFADLVASLGRPPVFVIGDLILDRYVWGSVSRVSPEAPVQILRVDREEFRVGGAANVARNLAALGARVDCGGVVGNDEGGRELLKRLKSRGVRATAVVRRAGRPTSVKTRMIAHNQQMLRVDGEDTTPVGGEAARRLLTKALRAEARAKLSIISDYHKGALPPALCEKFIRRAKGPVLVGLKGRDYRKYAGATGASLNRGEVLAITHEDDVDRAARKVIRDMRLEFLVVTLGERGMRVYPGKGRPITLPALARQVYDVTGAGDTALAAFGIGYASGMGLEDCALLANVAAGIVVAKVGTDSVTREEMVASGDEGNGHRKILPLPKLLKALEAERARGRRIVFTNGCFDLLHAGHASLLDFARAKGDVLVVGLNTDASVRKLKGRGRPLVGQAERARLLAALEAVDYVVFFDEKTVAPLVRKVRPDILVKGGDYGPKEVVGREHAGRVELAPLMKGLSTSELLRRIRGQ